MVAIYTAKYRSGRQTQSLAYSTDGAATWSKFRGNSWTAGPRTSAILVFWYDDGPSKRYWVMVAVEALDRKVVLYRLTT